MTQPPLNPDALEAGAKALFLRERKYHTPSIECPEPPNWEDLTETSMEHYRGNARAVLAVAQPEVNSDAELHVGTLIEDNTGRQLWHVWRTGGPGVLWLDDEGRPATPVFPARVLYRPEVKP